MLSYLQKHFPDNYYCRLIVNEGTRILRILLKSFYDEREVEESKKQSLNHFLEHFVCDNEFIGLMYLKLNTTEKIWLLQFSYKHLQCGNFNGFPLSVTLMMTICDELSSKVDHIYSTSVTNDIDFNHIMALFKVIATASSQSHYSLNKFPFQFILKISTLFKIFVAHGDECEKAFLAVSNDPDLSLKLLLLATISNIVKGNPANRDRV